MSIFSLQTGMMTSTDGTLLPRSRSRGRHRVKSRGSDKRAIKMPSTAEMTSYKTVQYSRTSLHVGSRCDWVDAARAKYCIRDAHMVSRHGESPEKNRKRASSFCHGAESMASGSVAFTTTRQSSSMMPLARKLSRDVRPAFSSAMDE